MDALILSCGTGGGHNAAAHAVADELSARGHHVVTLNPYELVGDRLTNAVDNTYITIAKNAPHVFGAIYCLGEVYRKLPFRSPVYYLNERIADVMGDYLSKNHFDVVVMSHLFPTEIMTALKRRGVRVPRTVFIATDYTCTPFTEETDCDCYIVPTVDLTGDFAKKGIDKDRLYPLGIPVGDGFSAESVDGSTDTRTACRRRLGLDETPEHKYLLISGGSMGAGRLERVVDILYRHYDRHNVTLIVVCGSNKKLYERVKKSYPDCIALEKTSDMADYVRACDLFITKPGGLSSSEAAVAGTALIHITPIPGCESKNMRFFEHHGMSVAVPYPRLGLVRACDRLLQGSERDRMAANQRQVVPHTAASDICNLIESQAWPPSGC